MLLIRVLVVSTIVLGWWTSHSIAGFHDTQYMALYGGIGGGQAIVTFLSTFAFAYVFPLLI